jgi:hypothetical protein
MGPEISIDPTPLATTNIMASRNGMRWLKSRAGLLRARSIVVGIVMVVMEVVSLLLNLTKPNLPSALQGRFDVSQTLRSCRFRGGSPRSVHPA